jgi:hypothetical protein
MKRKFIIFLLFILVVMLYPKESRAEKTGGDHARIWIGAGLDAIGIGKIAKGIGSLVRIFKPDKAELAQTFTEVIGKGLEINNAQRKLEDPTGAGWLTWAATTAAEVGGTILEFLPAVRVGKALLNAGYEYYRNWQDDWMEPVKKKPKPPYRKKPSPPYIPKPKRPANDHPDDYMGVLEKPVSLPPSDYFQMLLQEYNDQSLNYLAFEIGMSIDNPVCDFQMQKFITKLKTQNPDYESHLQDAKQKSESAYQAAYEVQKKICLLYYSTITENTEFPHFKTKV